MLNGIVHRPMGSLLPRRWQYDKILCPELLWAQRKQAQHGRSYCAPQQADARCCRRI